MHTATSHHIDTGHPANPGADEPILSQQFDDVDQQSEASVLGMWLFLATEVMFFGGLFTAYTIYRINAPREVALASRELNVTLGCINTLVLLTSSLTMAMAVRASQLRANKDLIRYLLATMVLGTVFLGIKAVEWTADYHEHLVPGINFQVPEKDVARVRTGRTQAGKYGAILRSLLFHDRPARHSPDHRHRPGRNHDVAFLARVVFRRRGRADRSDRTVLALHRHYLGVPLSLALFDRCSPMTQHIASNRTNFTIFIALIVLLLATVGGAYLPLGPLHFPMAMVIATAKAVLIVLYFMHVKYSHRLTAIICAASVLWLGVMVALTLNDYLSRAPRGWLDIPGK